MKSQWEWMSMKPGATTRPSTSITRRAGAPSSRPTRAILPPSTATSARNHGFPVPSTTRAFLRTRSNSIARFLPVRPGASPAWQPRPAPSLIRVEHLPYKNATHACSELKEEGISVTFGISPECLCHDVRDNVRRVRALEDAGFDYIWEGDHTLPWQHSSGHSAGIFTTLAAFLAETQRAVVGGMVIPALGIRHHPIDVAIEVATQALLYPGDRKSVV